MNTETTERVNSQIMELKDLIAGPLVATIDADSISAQRYLEYLFKIAFESYDSQTGKAGALRVLSFNYRSYEQRGSRTRAVIRPVKSLINISGPASLMII